MSGRLEIRLKANAVLALDVYLMLISWSRLLINYSQKHPKTTKLG